MGFSWTWALKEQFAKHEQTEAKCWKAVMCGIEETLAFLFWETSRLLKWLKNNVIWLFLSVCVCVCVCMCVCAHAHLVTQSCPTLWYPMDYSLPGSSVPEDSPGKYIGVVCHALHQEIFPIKGSNSGLPHCRQIFTIWATREALLCIKLFIELLTTRIDTSVILFFNLACP